MGKKLKPKLKPGTFVEVNCEYEYKATTDLKYSLKASSKPIYHAKYEAIVTHCNGYGDPFVVIIRCLDCVNEADPYGNVLHKYEKFGPSLFCLKDHVKIIKP